eukprot:3982081-Heterocapsa_arctica.AAC.1
MTPTTTTATRPHGLLPGDGRHGHQPARLLPFLPRAVRARPGDRPHTEGPGVETTTLPASKRLR